MTTLASHLRCTMKSHTERGEGVREGEGGGGDREGERGERAGREGREGREGRKGGREGGKVEERSESYSQQTNTHTNPGTNFDDTSVTYPASATAQEAPNSSHATSMTTCNQTPP